MTLHDTPRMFARGAVASVALVAVFTAGATTAGAAPHGPQHGTFAETASVHDLGYDIHGSAKMTISSEGTDVKVNVAGLDPTKTYGSHLHNGSCAGGGGGHYQNVEGGATTPPNELWLTTGGAVLQPNRGGVAHGAGSATWIARTSSTTQTNARSVVVHEPGTGARIACADLG